MTNQAWPLGLNLTYSLKLVMAIKNSTIPQICPTQRVVYKNMSIHIIRVNWIYVWQPHLKPMVVILDMKHLSTQRWEVHICLQECFKFFTLQLPKWTFELHKVGRKFSLSLPILWWYIKSIFTLPITHLESLFHLHHIDFQN